jgi:hypothetical protein
MASRALHVGLPTDFQVITNGAPRASKWVFELNIVLPDIRTMILIFPDINFLF